jgi:hypothetical protein
MPVRSFIAALVGFVALTVASAIIAAQRGVDFGYASDLLFGRAEGSFFCVALAWGWLGAGLLCVAGFFAAFADEADDADLPSRVRVPMGAPVALFLISAGLLWLALGCAAPRLVESVAAIAAPSPAAPADLDDALEGGEESDAPVDQDRTEPPTPDDPPPAPEPAPAPPPAPAVLNTATTLAWPYEYPRIRGEEIIGSPAMDAALAAFLPMDDAGGAVHGLLCDKAWVAFTGSASEEGPPDRNSTRARARARLAAERALAWLDAHRGCPRPIVLGVDLGQHVPTDAAGPWATAYQRQAIVIGRARATPDEALTAFEALAEMRAYYAGQRAALLGARSYRNEPSLFVPD